MKETDYQPGRSRFRFKTKGTRSREPTDSFKGRNTVPLQKNRKKNRIYLRTPDDYYSHHPDDPRDVTSSYQRDVTGVYYPSGMPKDRDPVPTNDLLYLGANTNDRIPGLSSTHDRMFARGNHNKRGIGKAMVIGETESMYQMPTYRRPELPGDLFVDNLRHKNIDWRLYDKVTWNDVLESHVKDVQSSPRSIAQTRPQREAWLASIDTRVRNSKMNSPRGLPGISQRIFNSKIQPSKEPAQARYLTRDRTGNLFYLVGPSDVTKQEHAPFILPEIVKASPSDQKHLDF